MLKIFIISLLFSVQFLFSQNLQYVSYYNWSNPKAYQIDKSPFITGYGIKSDSISKANDGKTYYEHNGFYLEISSWADYYNWHVQEYWFYWEMPELYEYFYSTNDDYNMSSYITTHFIGTYYPARVKPFSNGKKFEKVSNSRYANNENQIRRLKKESKRKNKQYDDINAMDKESKRKYYLNDYDVTKINSSKNSEPYNTYSKNNNTSSTRKSSNIKSISNNPEKTK